MTRAICGGAGMKQLAGIIVDCGGWQKHCMAGEAGRYQSGISGSTLNVAPRVLPSEVGTLVYRKGVLLI